MKYDEHRIEPGDKVHLEDIPTEGKKLHDDRDAAEAEFAALNAELAELQYRLYAENRRKLLVVLQARDCGGKDGTIRKVFRGVNPQGVRVTSFKAPTAQELAHDYLWRIHKAVPAAGMIGIFNRSQYEDVLIVRVNELVPKEVWQARYEQINQFENLLAETGTTIIKIYLHISKEEQKERLQARLDNPEKNWKFEPADLVKRPLWEDYDKAYEDMLERCSTRYAPWYVIPADNKWYRNLAIVRILVGTLRDMDPQFPPPAEGLDKVEIDG